MTKNYKTILKYILLFIFFFIFLVFFYHIYFNDTIVNYGFSYAIRMGEIPYKDFNMVITPFSSFMYSIGLFIYNNMITIYIEQSILLCLLIYFLEKLVHKNYILFILGLCIYYPISFSSTIFPGYNFLSFLLLIILLYLLKNNSDDILIGIILGLIFCTKQTIGIILFIPSIYYLFKNKKEFIKRLMGYLIPIFILFIYLIITNSLSQFINLCFLGLINFNNTNKSISIYYLILLIGGVIYLIYRIIKNKRDYELYYLLLFGVISLPIIDFYHVSLFLLGILYLICRDIKIKENIYKYLIIFILFLFLSSFYIEYLYFNKNIKTYNYRYFSLTVSYPKYNNKILKVSNYLKKYNNKIYLIRGSEAYFLRIINDEKITYYDLLNRGNFGYNGEEKIVEKINNLDSGTIFVTDSSLCKNKSINQFICSTYKVLDKCKLIKTIYNFNIYIKE